MKSKRTLCGLVAIVICIQAGAYRSVASTGSATGQPATARKDGQKDLIIASAASRGVTTTSILTFWPKH